MSIDESPSPLRVLEVHNVGSFEASFVPTVRDFARVDPRFRLPDGVLDALPIYSDYSFVVFKLKPGNVKPHPMVFSFPRRNAKELFFPTVHVHDGTVPELANFDHTLYCQSRSNSSFRGWDISADLERNEVEFEQWFREYMEGFGRAVESFTEEQIDQFRKMHRSHGSSFKLVEVPLAAARFIDIHRARGLVQDNAVVRRRAVYGLEPNKDLVFLDE